MSAALPIAGEAVRVRVDYDFASSLCYVAHRAMARLAPQLDEIGIALEWSPLDLASLLGWKRGAPVDALRRANVMRVSEELDVPLAMPGTWLDSRGAHAVALSLPPDREPVWRERVWSAVYDAGHRLDDALLDALCAELGVLRDEAAGLVELEARTRRAAAQEVSGLPNFMLGSWPFGGIQGDETMLLIFDRFARRERERRRRLS